MKTHARCVTGVCFAAVVVLVACGSDDPVTPSITITPVDGGGSGTGPRPAPTSTSVTPTDSGQPPTGPGDAASDDDANAPDADLEGGSPGDDSGTGGTDSGTGGTDSGTGGTDSGTGGTDSGTGGTDSGTGGTDSGTGGMDSGTGGTDSGTGGVDSGTGTDAGMTCTPAAADSCEAPGRDETCNGTPNEGCACVKGSANATKACGNCSLGTQSCNGGVSPSGYGACVEKAGTCTPGATEPCSVCAGGSVVKGSHACSGTCAYPSTCTMTAPSSYVGRQADFTHVCGHAVGTIWQAGLTDSNNCVMQDGNATQLVAGAYDVKFDYSYSCDNGNGFARAAYFQVLTGGTEVVSATQVADNTTTPTTTSKTVSFTVTAGAGCSASYTFPVHFDKDNANPTVACTVALISTTVTYKGP